MRVSYSWYHSAIGLCQRVFTPFRNNVLLSVFVCRFVCVVYPCNNEVRAFWSNVPLNCGIPRFSTFELSGFDSIEKQLWTITSNNRRLLNSDFWYLRKTTGMFGILPNSEESLIGSFQSISPDVTIWSVNSAERRCALWCNCIILAMITRMHTIAVYTFLYVEIRNVWRREGILPNGLLFYIVSVRGDVSFHRKTHIIPRMSILLSMTSILTPLVAIVLSITEITCALYVVSRQRANVPNVTPTTAAEIIRWQPGRTDIKNRAGKTRVVLKETKTLCVLGFNFLIGKSKFSRSPSQPRKKSSPNKRKRSVCRPLPLKKANSVALCSLLHDRDLGPRYSRCVRRPNGGRSRPSPFQQSHWASEYASASTESMERRQDFMGERRHDASAWSRSVLSALQAAAEIRVPNHAAIDLSVGFGREEQGGISGDRLWIACRVYVLLVVCLYPLNDENAWFASWN